MSYGGGRPKVQGESHLLANEGLDVILGMDWLSINHVIIDCRRCNVVFLETVGLELISAQKVMNEEEV